LSFQIKMNQISAFGIHFDEDDLIRKQREEIILLTKELRNHDELIEKYESTTNKLKQSLKKMEKEKQEFSCKVVSLNAELNQTKNEFKKSNDEKKALETKLTQKDAYIQTQSKKIHELSTNYEKCQLELSNLGKLYEVNL
jgi:chromosome segregation ATPase